MTLDEMLTKQYMDATYPMPEAAPADDFTQMATEMAGGTEPEGTKPMTLRQFAETAADAPAALLKGSIQGSAGLVGDTIAFGKGILAAANPNEGEDRIDAFLRGIGDPVTAFGYNITTEGIKNILDNTLGPVVPAGSRPERVEAAKTAEGTGEFFGAAKAAIQGGKAIAQGARQIGREMATTPPTGAVQLAPTPVQAPRSELGFYSAVEETVANLPQAKGTGQQFLAQISKTAGIKPEEIQWTGLDEFLKGKKSVTKQEVQDYLAANRVDVREVRLEASTGQRIPLTNEEQARLNVLREREQTEGLGGLESEEYSDLLNKEIAFEEFYDKTRFSDSTLPGGENYREILLTLPAKQLTEAEARVVLGAAPDAKLSSADIAYASRKNVDEYRSTHFDQPNILAHLRVNDRTVDGKKTLFVEEIQSDWHQAGRKKGYASADTKNAEDAFRQYSQELADKYNLNPEQNLAMYATMKGMQPEEVAKYDQLQSAWVSSKGAVPDAPFKTSWHELSLKRAIQEASEKGYDQIAFTTGKTQAERYDLSKQVSQVNIEKTPDGFSVQAIDKDGKPAIFANANANNLDDYVGKDLAQKAIKDLEGSNQVSYSGLDLQVGGEGMKGFYDNILPKSLDKLGKKFGAKVGKTEMDGAEVWQMDITPKMRESVVSKGQPLFVAPIAAPGMMQEEETK